MRDGPPRHFDRMYRSHRIAWWISTIAASATVIATVLGYLQWRQSKNPPNPVPAPSPIVSTSLPTPTASPSIGNLKVVTPDEGPVDLSPIVRVGAQASPGYVLVVLIQATGSDWYPTRCTADANSDTSSCGGARFGVRARDGGSWNMVAVLLTSKKAQEIFTDRVFRGDINRLGAQAMSKSYSYYRDAE